MIPLSLPVPAQLLRVQLCKPLFDFDGYEFQIVYPRRHRPGDWRVGKTVILTFTTKANRKGIVGDYLREHMEDMVKEVSRLMSQGAEQRRKR